jgi:hypothetical protein
MHEPQETCFGYTRRGVAGRGLQEMADYALREIYSSDTLLREINRIEDIKIFVPAISDDRVSDMYVNVIRGVLIEYTQEQCAKHGIPMHIGDSGMFWDVSTHSWKRMKNAQQYVWRSRRILLVPKNFLCGEKYDAHSFFNNCILPYYREQELRNIDSKIVKYLKDGTPKIYKKDLEADLQRRGIVAGKESALKYAENHPECIEFYRRNKAEMRKKRGVT